MRAMVLHRQAPIGASPLSLEELPVPQPGRGEVLLRVAACGLCHTDLHIIEEDLPLMKTPLVPGHQIVGMIELLGPEVVDRRVGERVGVPWISSACGGCRHCLGGRENLCRRAVFTGYHVDGGYAEFVVVPAAAAHPLRLSLSDSEAAPLLCAGIIGYRALRLCELQPGGRLGLFGFGASAHLALQVARHWGCEVSVFTRSQRHRRVAARLGARWTGSATERPPEPLDAAVVFAPAGWIVAEALTSLECGGTLAINAIHMDEIPALDYRKHLYGERTLRSVTNLTHRDAREFLQLAAEIPLQVVVESFRLEDANRGLQTMAAGGLEAAGVLLP